MKTQRRIPRQNHMTVVTTEHVTAEHPIQLTKRERRRLSYRKTKSTPFIPMPIYWLVRISNPFLQGPLICQNPYFQRNLSSGGACTRETNLLRSSRFGSKYDRVMNFQTCRHHHINCCTSLLHWFAQKKSESTYLSGSPKSLDTKAPGP